jgi:oligoendopeptidase F
MLPFRDKRRRAKVEERQMTATTEATQQRVESAPREPERLPHWDMSRYFPAVQSPELHAAFDRLVRDIGELRTLFDHHGVRGGSSAAGTPGASGSASSAGTGGGPRRDLAVAAFEEVVQRQNALHEELRTLYAYLSSFVSTNSRDDAAQGMLSELQVQLVELRKLGTRFEAWLGTLDVEALIEGSAVAREHAFPVRKAAQSARHLMSEAEEDLAASLSPSGGTAWGKLHGNVSSQLMVPVVFPESAREDRAGKTVELPMSAVRALAHDPDQEVRRAAYEAELKGWERAAVPLAAAMNGIKGEVRTLNARRGWSDDLEPSLFDNNIDRATLDAMHEACREAFPDFRRYLRAKARLFGAQQLPWYDLFAPVGGSETRRWSFPEAMDFVAEQFGTYAGPLADVARRAVRERWIDAEPRDGKRDGAFCMPIRAGESGVFVNFEPSFTGVSTLAHELGHAYHNTQLARRTPLQRDTPMPLAETASIFCQTLVNGAALQRLTGPDKLAVLEHELQDACQVVVDIHSRFLIESRIFERRAKRELAVAELNALMLEAQRETYGDGLDPRALHQYMWAMKPHYYSTGRSFYNWPYTFGQLFGLGLFARYRQDADAFRAGYDDLLASTGLFPVAELAQRFGIDVRSADFWRASLDVIREQIRQFEELTAK